VSSPLATPAAAPSSSGRPLRFLILADGSFGAMTSKTANACLRYTPERAVAVLDAAQPGRTAQQVLGFGGAVPVVATLAEGSPSARRPSSSASRPAGGRSPTRGGRCLAEAARRGLDLWSGPAHAPRRRSGRRRRRARGRGPVVDLRRPPADLTVAAGRVRDVDATVVLTVGSDCNIGKMTTQLQLRDAMRARGGRVAFAPTGQTGILIEGRGIAVDA
jgi:uncharacterized NAD-dependent epimerase/dehydratase family protein